MLGKRIATLRKQRNLSQYELAKRLGFSRGKLSNYEQGSRSPDYETLKKIADFFGVSHDFLLLGKEDNKNEIVSEIADLMGEAGSEKRQHKVNGITDEIERLPKEVQESLLTLIKYLQEK